MPRYVSIGNIFIDDILLWDGRMYLGVLGGAGCHAISGMRVWSSDLGLLAQAGTDLSPEHQKQLLELGLDVSGLLFLSERTARAWQIFHPDERRIEIYRFPDGAKDKVTPSFELLPAAYRKAEGFHIYWDGILPQLAEQIQKLRLVNHFARLIWEPAERHIHDSAQAFRFVLPAVDVFSPNQLEGAAITAKDDPVDICQSLADWGASCVALRMGREGSLVREPDGTLWQIPAYAVNNVVDVTGAGNAYCGGLTVALAAGYSIFESACRAAVSASFSLEQYGMPQYDDTHLPDERRSRLEWVQKRAGKIAAYHHQIPGRGS